MEDVELYNVLVIYEILLMKNEKKKMYFLISMKKK